MKRIWLPRSLIPSAAAREAVTGSIIVAVAVFEVISVRNIVRVTTARITTIADIPFRKRSCCAIHVALNERKISYSFGELKELIRSGNAVEGFYENELLKKRLELWRPIKLGAELEEIFRKLMIKIPGFDVKESIPTDF